MDFLNPCPRCDGEGITIFGGICEKCYGAGQLNWIEMVLGKALIYNHLMNIEINKVLTFITNRLKVLYSYLEFDEIDDDVIASINRITNDFLHRLEYQQIIFDFLFNVSIDEVYNALNIYLYIIPTKIHGQYSINIRIK